MSIKAVYQTLENRDTELNQLEENGPYSCKWENSWLGDGYYFWDTFIENAHWWGKEIRCYSSGYIICKAICDFNDIDCFDLVGNTEHLTMIDEAFGILKNEGLANSDTTVRRIIEFLKKNMKQFNYSAIRVLGFKVKNYKSQFSSNVFFERNNSSAYLDCKPPIQICFYRKKSLNLRDYHIVYPEESSLDYV